tara:strand:+ start:51 stop:497 length:447 start_codon:yes stop_codon:yes gene_type:complete
MDLFKKKTKSYFTIFLFICLISGQTTHTIGSYQSFQINTQTFINNYSKTSKDAIKTKESKYKKNHHLWFYNLGPYNDLWGSDILKFPQLGVTRANLRPSNKILNISAINNNPLLNSRFTYLTFFGFPVKKLGNTVSNLPFYGPEKIDH